MTHGQRNIKLRTELLPNIWRNLFIYFRLWNTIY